MTDQNDLPSTPPPAEGPTWLPADVPAGTPAAEPPPPRASLLDRAFGIRSLAAVGVAALLIGGGVGAAVGAGGGDPDGPEQAGFGVPPGGPGAQGGPDGQSVDEDPDGELPPAAAPDDDDHFDDDADDDDDHDEDDDDYDDDHEEEDDD